MANSAPAAGKTNSERHLPGTLFSFHIPAGTAVNFVDMFEINTPTGMSVSMRLPFLSHMLPGGSSGNPMAAFMNFMKVAGGTMEIFK